MDASKVELSRTELDFLHRLLLDLQQRLDASGDAGGGDTGSAIELALALLRWDGTTPPEFDAQLGLGAAVEMKLGLDAMCAYRQWRTERRKAPVTP